MDIPGRRDGDVAIGVGRDGQGRVRRRGIRAGGLAGDGIPAEIVARLCRFGQGLVLGSGRDGVGAVSDGVAAGGVVDDAVGVGDRVYGAEANARGAVDRNRLLVIVALGGPTVGGRESGADLDVSVDGGVVVERMRAGLEAGSVETGGKLDLGDARSGRDGDGILVGGPLGIEGGICGDIDRIRRGNEVSATVFLIPAGERITGGRGHARSRTIRPISGAVVAIADGRSIGGVISDFGHWDTHRTRISAGHIAISESNRIGVGSPNGVQDRRRGFRCVAGIFGNGCAGIIGFDSAFSLRPISECVTGSGEGISCLCGGVFGQRNVLRARRGRNAITLVIDNAIACLPLCIKSNRLIVRGRHNSGIGRAIANIGSRTIRGGIPTNEGITG